MKKGHLENYHSDCDINPYCTCHHFGCDQLHAFNGIRRTTNRKYHIIFMKFSYFLPRINTFYHVE